MPMDIAKTSHVHCQGKNCKLTFYADTNVSLLIQSALKFSWH